jgi:CubicO group peptidase (beta-lactamase class C family)
MKTARDLPLKQARLCSKLKILFCLGMIAIGLQFPTTLVSQEMVLQEDDQIRKIIEQAVEGQPIPGAIAAMQIADGPLRIAAVGVRKSGSDEKMTINDQIHLGSCTKAITATMIARLVEQKKLDWDLTIERGLPDVSKQIHADYRQATLRQLLQHRAGVPANAPNWWLDAGPESGKELMALRKKIAVASLQQAPSKKPGEAYEYSNLGYMLAGMMAEQVTGKDAEALLREWVFDPLDMQTADFGPPGTKGEIDQPWGHVLEADKLKPLQHDNAPALGPAGRAHMSMADWSKFIYEHRRQDQGKIVSPRMRQTLQTPPKGADYAFGWIVTERTWAKSTAITHSGSNTMWFAVVWFAPKRQATFMAAINIAHPDAAKVCDQIIGQMIRTQLD